jgi:subtilisin family serine protease
MKKLHIALGVLSLAMLFSCTKDIQETPAINNEVSSAANSNAVSENAGDPYVADEILVKFKANTSDDKKDKAFKRIGGTVSEKILTKAMKHAGDEEGVYLVKASVKTLEAISKIQGVEIEYAEPNWIYTHDAESNDTYYTNGSLWGMYGDAFSPANQYGSQAAEAWAAGRTGSSTVYVGIIDEGAMWNHEDLTANFGNPNEIYTNGKDDDGNGYVDDTYGWDFVSNDKTTFDGTADNHGTHVAGTIGAKGGNSVGVAGVNWFVKMISAKFFDNNGGTTANAIKAVDYFTNLKTSQKLNIVATNNSWGSVGYSEALKDAIDRANVADILFVAAAGNSSSNNDATAPIYPASYPSANIISVASITSTGGLSYFSSYGATTVDIGAPGSDIYSTLPGSGVRGKKVTSTYGSYSGTSMATPHVTGGAALYAAYHPGSTAAQIKYAILSSAVFTSSLDGKCATNGRLNVSGF